MNKKKINVYFVDMPKKMDNNVNINGCLEFIEERLSKYYDLVFDKNNPKYVFCDIYGTEFVKYSNSVRIVATVEEYFPNFDVYDYSITAFSGLNFNDRVFFSPILLLYPNARAEAQLIDCRNKFTKDDLKNKTEFCSFVQSKDFGADEFRVKLFKELSKYKKVNSGGRVLNNIGHIVEDKTKFESNHKFSISCMNGKMFCICDRPASAIAARTIPIYWGNPNIGEILNSKAFVNCMDFENIDEVVKKVKEIDDDDELYIKMINEPLYVDKSITLENELKRFDEFLINIIENGTNQRSGAKWQRQFEKELYYGRKKTTRITKIANTIRPITRIIFRGKFMLRIKSFIIKRLYYKNTKKLYREIK